MNFKMMAVIAAVVAALSIPVLVAANSGNAATTQGNAGVAGASDNCTQDQLRLRDGSCGGDGAGDQVQLRTQTRLQTGECTRAQVRDGSCGNTGDGAQNRLGTQEGAQAGDCTQSQLRDQTCVNSGDCNGDQLRTRDCDQTCSGDQDQTRTQQRLHAGK